MIGSDFRIGSTAVSALRLGTSLIWEPVLQEPVNQPAGWTPSALFQSGELGGWWDPSDLSTMFQNDLGTVPVTSSGDPVGYIADKSGNSWHMTQGTSARRPTYQTNGSLHWLEFDGVDDEIALPTMDFSTASVFSAHVGYSSSMTGGIRLFESTPLEIYANAQSGGVSRMAGWNDNHRSTNISGVTENTPYVFTGIVNFTTGEVYQERTPGGSATATGMGLNGNFSPLRFDIMKAGTGGKIYGLTFRFQENSLAETAEVEQFYAVKTGTST